MQRSILVSAALLCLLAFAATTAHADTLARPVRHYDGKGSHPIGVDGLTLLRVHGGFSIPTGDFGDVFDMGLGVGANIAHGVSRTVLLSGGFAYHHFDGGGFGGDATVVPITFNAECLFPGSGKAHPYLGGGVGFYDINVDTGPIVVPFFGVVSSDVSETNFGINLGGGVAWRSSSKGVWGVGFRYHHVFEGDTFDDLDFATIQAGYGFYL